VFGSQSGNSKLQPITAKIFDLGLVVTPIDKLALTADYIRYSISNEVAELDANKILETEAACRLGQLDIGSPTCVAALSEVTRNASGSLVSVYTPKQNVSRENLGVMVLGLNYKYRLGPYGEIEADASYTDTLLHTYQQFPGDPFIDDLNDPFYSQEFKTKGNVELTWTLEPVSVSAYVERYGKTPNYISQDVPEGYGLPGAGDVGAWTLADFSVRYRPVKSLEVSVAINNAFNTMPPADHSQPGTTNQPYNELNYNVYGREFFLQLTYKPARK
jgi:outer membrane receptor protein involved in Fe transport